MKHLLALGVAALLVCASVGMAYPNLNAATGILSVPNGYTVANGAFSGAADILFHDDTTLNTRAIVGLSNQLEAGAAVILGDDTALGISAKYRLPVTGTSAWALGLSFITSNDNGSGTQAYIAASRSLTGTATPGVNLLGTLGASFTDLDNTSGFRPFIGGQLLLPKAFEIDAEFELESGDFNESISSLSVRKSFNPRLSGEFGFTNAVGFVATGSHDFFMGLSYNFAKSPVK